METCPKSVAILIVLLPLKMLNPQGFAASWGVEKGNIFKSFNSKDELFSEEYQFTDVYNDLKKKLIMKGIPEDEIKFIHEADTEAKKKDLFSKVRNGSVRVLIGSTQKMRSWN